MYSDKLDTYIARIVERTIAGRFSERHALVTSYDPKTYRAKVRFQPSGQTSGWLPIETGHIGNGYGMAIGLVPGDGEKTGDQVVVRFQENDFEGGKIVQRVHSDVDKPPMVESGEMVMWTQWGQQIRLNKDGSITFKTAVPTQQDQPAQSTVSSPEFTPESPPTPQQPQVQKKQQKSVTVTIDDQGNHTIDAQSNIIATAGSDHVITASGSVFEQAGGSIGNVAGGSSGYVAGGDLGVQAGRKMTADGFSAVVIQGGGTSASRGSANVKGDNPPIPPFLVPR